MLCGWQVKAKSLLMNKILAGLECQHTTNASSVTLSSGSATSSLFLDSTGDEHHLLRPGGYCYQHNNTHHSSDDLSTYNDWESHQVIEKKNHLIFNCIYIVTFYFRELDI